MDLENEYVCCGFLFLKGGLVEQFSVRKFEEVLKSSNRNRIFEGIYRLWESSFRIDVILKKPNLYKTGNDSEVKSVIDKLVSFVFTRAGMSQDSSNALRPISANTIAFMLFIPRYQEIFKRYKLSIFLREYVKQLNFQINKSQKNELVTESHVLFHLLIAIENYILVDDQEKQIFAEDNKFVFKLIELSQINLREASTFVKDHDFTVICRISARCMMLLSKLIPQSGPYSTIPHIKTWLRNSKSYNPKSFDCRHFIENVCSHYIKFPNDYYHSQYLYVDLYNNFTQHSRYRDEYFHHFYDVQEYVDFSIHLLDHHVSILEKNILKKENESQLYEGSNLSIFVQCSCSIIHFFSDICAESGDADHVYENDDGKMLDLIERIMILESKLPSSDPEDLVVCCFKMVSCYAMFLRQEDNFRRFFQHVQKSKVISSMWSIRTYEKENDGNRNLIMRYYSGILQKSFQEKKKTGGLLFNEKFLIKYYQTLLDITNYTFRNIDQWRSDSPETMCSEQISLYRHFPGVISFSLYIIMPYYFPNLESKSSRSELNEEQTNIVRKYVTELKRLFFEGVCFVRCLEAIRKFPMRVKVNITKFLVDIIMFFPEDTIEYFNRNPLEKKKLIRKLELLKKRSGVLGGVDLFSSISGQLVDVLGDPVGKARDLREAMCGMKFQLGFGHYNRSKGKCAKLVCEFCQEHFEKLFNCSKCKKVYYCGRRCQIKDWKLHKKVCSI